MRGSPIFLLAFSLAACGEPPTTDAPPSTETSYEPPNIVVILADDLGYGDLGAYGGTTIQTPHIDGLARDGVRLTDGYVAAAVCSPSRAGLQTGRYPTGFGYEFNDSGGGVAKLPTDLRTLGNLMQDAGYVTGLIGKWHLGQDEPHNPLNRGYDEFFGGSSPSYIDSRIEGVQSWPADMAPMTSAMAFDGFQRVEVEGYLTDVYAEKAVDFIARHKDERFFLMLTPKTPHTPIQATAEYTDRYVHIEEDGRRIFSAMVASLDDYVGDVVDELREHGLEENTLVVFFSDNGCVNYMPAEICTNAPLSGAKRYHLEGGIRVPFLFKWPARLARGTVYREPIISLDLYSTFAAVAGSEERGLDSVDLMPHLLGAATGPPHELLFWRAKPNLAVRWGKWKMWKVNKTDLGEDDFAAFPRLLPVVAHSGESPMGQMTVLYDLSVDESEQTNLAEEHPEIVERLEGELATWNSTLADPMWPATRSTVHELHGEMVRLFF